MKRREMYCLSLLLDGNSCIVKSFQLFTNDPATHALQNRYHRRYRYSRNHRRGLPDAGSYTEGHSWPVYAETQKRL